jgi:hypothetical protein
MWRAAFFLVATCAALPLFDYQKEVCLHTKDRALCESDACPSYAWCVICDKCLYEEHAVKDEL